MAVLGAGGFIGGHLIARLLEDHHDVMASDIKSRNLWWQWHDIDNWAQMDCRVPSNVEEAVQGVDWVFNLAADMGGMGHLAHNDATIMHSNLLISLHAIEASRQIDARYMETSSACVYREDLQMTPDNPGLTEFDAYPAMPEMGYGWAKLMGERLATYYADEFGMNVRLPRLHNVYGELGSWCDGREKAPAAICRKVAEAKLTGSNEIEIWSDGEQTRSFLYVSDCVNGLMQLMGSNISEPLNIGSEEMVTINELVSVIEEIAGVTVYRRYNLDAPQGVRGRSSDNTRTRSKLGWEPSLSLREGLEITYRWVEAQVESLVTT